MYVQGKTKWFLSFASHHITAISTGCQQHVYMFT